MSTVIAQELLRQQRDIEPKEDLADLVGEWVVLRSGAVVDHDVEMAQLIGRGVLKDGDALLQVTGPSESLLF